MRTSFLPLEALGLSPIATALLARPELVPGFRVPTTLADIPQPADRLLREDRQALVDAIGRHLSALTPPVAVVDSLRKLVLPGACVVIAGQQPGFLASPLYNLHKALHVVRLARSLEQAWERPVVPMFWNHADDHDLAEVNHAFLANQNLDLQRVGLSSLSSGRQPLSRIVLTEERHRLAPVRATLEELTRGEPHAAEAVDLFCPRPGESLARAFTRTMTELCGPFGLVMLEPDWIRSELSRALSEFVGREQTGAGPHGFEDALAAGEAAVRAVGLSPQIDLAEAALLYRVDAAGRSALRRGGDGFRYDGEEGSRTRAELAAEILQEPAGWSPAALTRAICQDRVLPVAAYVGGLGEMAYHAQLVPLRDFARVPRTPFVPRFSCTLIEPEVDDSLRKLELTAEAVIRSRGAVGEGNDETEPAVIARLREVGQRAAREVTQERAALAELDAGLAANLKRTGDQMRSLIEKICEKAANVHQNRAGRGKRHYRRVSQALFPRESPQERVLGPLPFVARYGRDWIADLLDHVPALGREHALVHLGPPDSSPEDPSKAMSTPPEAR